MSYLCKGAVVTRCRKSIGGSILPLLMAGIALALLAQGSTALGQHGVRAAPSPVARTAPPGKFADVLIPYGIAVDGDGYVYASSVDPNNVFQYLLTQYDSNGTVLQQVASGEGGNLAWDAGANSSGCCRKAGCWWLTRRRWA
jgi:hypothetical protein